MEILHRLGGKRNRYLGAPLLQAHYKSSVSLPDLDSVSSCREPQLRTLVTGKGKVTRQESWSVECACSQRLSETREDSAAD